MKESTAVRISAEMSFVLALLSGAFSLGTELPAMLVLLGGILVFGTLAVAVRSGALRALLSLLPGAAFFLTESIPLRIVICLAMVYFVLVMTIGNFHVEYLTVQFIMKVMAVLALIFLFTFIAKAVSQGEKTDTGLLVCFFLFFVLGIIALRSLRLGVSLDRKQQMTNAAIVLTPALAGVGAFGFFYFLLTKLGPYLMYPLNLLLAWLYSLFHHDVVHGREEHLYIEPDFFKVPATEIAPDAYKDAEEYLSKEDVSAHFLRFGNTEIDWKLIVVIAAVVLTLALILLYVKLHKKGTDKSAQFEETEVYSAGGRRKRHKKHETNASKVREIYREYLFFLRLKGVEIESDDTSLEILNDSQGLFSGEAAAKLRETYIRARYSDGDDISAEDVKLAEECFRQLREEQK